MKIAIIQSGNNGFFPRFYKMLRKAIVDNGDDCRLFTPNSGCNRRTILDDQIIWGTRFNWYIHALLYKLSGKQDIYSHFSTYDLIWKMNRYKPDILHLHVVNEQILNLPILINYCNKKHVKVVWTMHDCRAFTGGCPYFEKSSCCKWINGCKGVCPEPQSSKRHNAMWTWKFRKKYLSKLDSLTVVTPSEWMENYVHKSFLANREIKTIYNGVDTFVFSSSQPTDLRCRYNLENKKIILGCGINWEPRKGLQFFEQVATDLPFDYKIVLVGIVAVRDLSRLAEKGILAVGRTQNVEEMAAWYQAASVFVNPTLADNFPTTNIEALASGTPVVTFRTGGSPEAVDSHTGIVVDQYDIAGLKKAIFEVVENPKVYSPQACIERSGKFSAAQYCRYVELYHSII